MKNKLVRKRYYQKIDNIIISHFKYLMSIFLFNLRILKEKEKYFIYEGGKYRYFNHKYNFTRLNERSVEVSIIKEVVNCFKGKNILEVGNVLSHYFLISHEVLDKYERACGIINKDIIDFKPLKKYDLIVSISTLEHIGWDEKPIDINKIFKAVKKIKKMLTTNGVCLVTIPLGYNGYLDKILLKNNNLFIEKNFFKKTSLFKWENIKYDDLLKQESKIKYHDPYYAANYLAICKIK